MPNRIVTLSLCFVFALLLVLNLSALGQGGTKAAPDAAQSKVMAVLKTQQSAWNRGDIPEFMKYYWNSEKLTFSSGGKTTRGWKTTKDRYQKRYPDKRTMGQLAFSKLEFQSLGPQAALVLGRWELKRDEPIGGNFSLVFKEIGGQWLIIHDHSSEQKKKD